MKVNEIKQEFERLNGLRLQYKGQQMIISGVKVNRDKLSIFTDVRTFVLFPSEADAMLEEIEVIGDVIETTETIGPESSAKVVMSGYSSNADKVTEALMAQLEIISKSDKIVQSQLDKAKAMSQLANTLVNVEKVKLEYLNLMQK